MKVNRFDRLIPAIFAVLMFAALVFLVYVAVSFMIGALGMPTWIWVPFGLILALGGRMIYLQVIRR